LLLSEPYGVLREILDHRWRYRLPNDPRSSASCARRDFSCCYPDGDQNRRSRLTAGCAPTAMILRLGGPAQRADMVR